MPRGKRATTEATGRPGAGGGRAYMISVVSKVYGIHPQTLRLYEREGLLKPSRTEGNSRLYSDEDLRQLEVILNLRRRMEQMQQEVNEFVEWVRRELGQAAQDGWQERLQQALVRLPPTPLVRAEARPVAAEGGAAGEAGAGRAAR